MKEIVTGRMHKSGTSLVSALSVQGFFYIEKGIPPLRIVTQLFCAVLWITGFL